MLTDAEKLSASMPENVAELMQSLFEKSENRTSPLVRDKCKIVKHPDFGRVTVTTCAVNVGEVLIVEPGQLTTSYTQKELKEAGAKWVTPQFMKKLRTNFPDFPTVRTILPPDMNYDFAVHYLKDILDQGHIPEVLASQTLITIHTICDILLKDAQKRRHILDELAADIIPMNDPRFPSVAGSQIYRMNTALLRTIKEMPKKWPLLNLLSKFSDDELWKILNITGTYCFGLCDDSGRIHQNLSGDLISMIPNECRNPSAVVTGTICNKTKKFIGNVVALKPLEKGSIVSASYRPGGETLPRFLRQIFLFHRKGFWCKCNTCMNEKPELMRSLPCPSCTPRKWTYRGPLMPLDTTPANYRPLSKVLATAALTDDNRCTSLSFFLDPDLTEKLGYVHPTAPTHDNDLFVVWKCDKCGLKTKDPWTNSKFTTDNWKDFIELSSFETALAAALFIHITEDFNENLLGTPNGLARDISKFTLFLGEKHGLIWHSQLLQLKIIHVSQVKPILPLLKVPFRQRNSAQYTDEYLHSLIWEAFRRTDVIFYRLLSVWPFGKGLDGYLANDILKAALEYTNLLNDLMELTSPKEVKNLIVGGIACVFICTLTRIRKVCTKAVFGNAWLDFVQDKCVFPIEAFFKMKKFSNVYESIQTYLDENL